MVAVQGKDNVKRAQSYGAVGPASLQEAQSCSDCFHGATHEAENGASFPSSFFSSLSSDCARSQKWSVRAQGSHQHLSATGLVSQPRSRGESPWAFSEVPIHWSNHLFTPLQIVLSNTILSFQLCHSFLCRKEALQNLEEAQGRSILI